jgi:hypothetical protein
MRRRAIRKKQDGRRDRLARRLQRGDLPLAHERVFNRNLPALKENCARQADTLPGAAFVDC